MDEGNEIRISWFDQRTSMGQLIEDLPLDSSLMCAHSISTPPPSRFQAAKWEFDRVIGQHNHWYAIRGITVTDRLYECGQCVCAINMRLTHISIVYVPLVEFVISCTKVSFPSIRVNTYDRRHLMTNKRSHEGG